MRALLADYGLQVVELTLDLAMIYPRVFDARFYARVAALQQELGFVCSVHLPFLWVDPSSLNEPVRQASTACLARSSELTQDLEVDAYVLHLWGRISSLIAAEFREPAQRQAALAALRGQMERSLVEASEHIDPGKLCVENLEDSLFRSALPLLERYGTGICLDVGHLGWEGTSELDFWMQHHDQIREVHLHDATRPSKDGEGVFRDHMALGRGQVEFARLWKAMEDHGYEGPVILEVNSRGDLEESLGLLRGAGLI
jgi:sugar phosphate isomerase/epimerase